ncbi:response regulator [Billgrantia tianxiuensis]|jgi:signal transduction histidine kinase|uniref:histidine kinase n=1 Tax=Billgrantia tianxiuensis TaxID=2497861 RepID=A0A6I6SMD4_9GAMM|nr:MULTISPECIES: PAS-domain containing protein [Halomonas]MCE8035385.1 response regulator [Halomonas sp. MCCC 1A11057]MDX5502409.1 PAS-domain containing protein [Halomonas sp.]QHC51819.1 response regulator [Halomonas tianxiuensis]
MGRWTLQRRALAALVVATLLALGLVLVAWFGLTQTRNAVSEFEARTLPEIRTALTLSEEVAQLAALAPYVASAAKPFLLQIERDRLTRRFQSLVAVAASIRDRPFREMLEAQLNALQADIDRLTDLMESELFLREDLLTAQFEVTQIVVQGAEFGGAPSLTRWQILEALYQGLSNPDQWIGQWAILAEPPDPDMPHAEAYRRLLELAEDSAARMAQINQQKAFLLASLRARSERLTGEVNGFAGALQREVVIQQQTVHAQVNRVLLGMMLMTGLLILGVILHYMGNLKTIRDLGVVTQDMVQLAQGGEAPKHIAITRHDEIGTLARAYEVFRDHAGRIEQAGHDLRAQKHLLETVFNEIQDGLSVFSADDRLIAWNRRYLDMFGLTPGAIGTGMPLAEVQRQMARHPHRNVTLANRSVDMSTINLRRHQVYQSFERHYDDGRVIEFRSQPMPGGGFVTLYSDLSDRRTIEQQLQQAQKMEVLGQLTGGVAHDFNNLLAALLGNLQLLEQQAGLPERARRYTERALDVGERGTQLVQRLLAFSRKQHLQPEWVYIDALIDGLEELLEYSVSAHTQLLIRLQAPDTRLYIDPSQLENAILNLALNSSAAMPRGGQLVIATEFTPGEKPAVTITVRDTGQGIPAELQARVLEPFFTTKPMGQGSGLGLSSVYGFVTQSGGEFSMESEPGRGTAVRLSWPVQSVTAPSLPAASTVLAVAVPVDTCVVVVEDDAEVRRVTAELIAAHRSVASFRHAEQALDWLRDNAASTGLVLTDVNLDGALSGVDLREQVRRLWPMIPVVLASGMPREALEREYGLSMGDAFLQKPIRPEQWQAFFDAPSPGR